MLPYSNLGHFISAEVNPCSFPVLSVILAPNQLVFVSIKAGEVGPVYMDWAQGTILKVLKPPQEVGSCLGAQGLTGRGWSCWGHVAHRRAMLWRSAQTLSRVLCGCSFQRE